MDYIQFGSPGLCLVFRILEEFLPERTFKHLLLWGMRSVMTFMMLGGDWEHSHLVLGLLMLPWLPTLLEQCGLPVTRSLSGFLNTMLSFLTTSHFLALPECPERVQQHQQDLLAADQRVAQGQRQAQESVQYIKGLFR